MSERYRLVFRGEVLEGQHKAVVKQRLGEVLKVDGARLDAMFTGKAVTIRKDADTDTAAKFQIAFKRAGARLRVLPIEIEPEVEAATPAASEPSEGGFVLSPVGTTLVEPRAEVPAPAVDIAHMTLAAPGVALSAPTPVVAVVPEVAKWTLAAPGSVLGVPAPAVTVRVDAPSWEIAELGVDLTDRVPATDPPLDLDEIDFELAPPGALLADADQESPPAPPDTSHLRLA